MEILKDNEDMIGTNKKNDKTTIKTKCIWQYHHSFHLLRPLESTVR